MILWKLRSPTLCCCRCDFMPHSFPFVCMWTLVCKVYSTFLYVFILNRSTRLYHCAASPLRCWKYWTPLRIWFTDQWETDKAKQTTVTSQAFPLPRPEDWTSSSADWRRTYAFFLRWTFVTPLGIMSCFSVCSDWFHRVQVYVAAGTVYGLEAELGDLEECARSIGGSTTERELAHLEDQVASAAAQVQQSELQVCSAWTLCSLSLSETHQQYLITLKMQLHFT